MRRISVISIPAVLLAALPMLADTVILTSGNSYMGQFTGGVDGKLTFQDTQNVQYQFPIGEVQSLSFTASGDTITLRNGKTYTGQITGQDNNTIPFTDRQGIGYQFPTNEISALVFTGHRDGAQAGPGSGRVLPVGSVINVITNESINSQNAQPGQTFGASINADVLDGTGNVLIPRGSPATLLIRSESGGGVRSGRLVLDLDSITVNGSRYSVASSDVTENNRKGLGANKRTAYAVGGTSALGALIGAIAGGGRGAGIGALAGAGAGAAGEVLTKGKDVRVPAETKMSFELDKTLVLHPM